MQNLPVMCGVKTGDRLQFKQDAIVDDGVGSDVVSDGELTILPILEVRDTFIPVVALQTAQIGPGHEGLVALHLKLDLKGESHVAFLVRRGHTAVDHKYGDGTRSLWNASFGAVALPATPTAPVARTTGTVPYFKLYS